MTTEGQGKKEVNNTVVDKLSCKRNDPALSGGPTPP
jgi:hypothetical protein